MKIIFFIITLVSSNTFGKVCEIYDSSHGYIPALKLVMSIEVLKGSISNDQKNNNCIYFYIEDDQFFKVIRYKNNRVVDDFYFELSNIKSKIKNLDIKMFDYEKEKEMAYAKKKQAEQLEILFTETFDGSYIKLTIATEKGNFSIEDIETVDTISYLSEYSERFKKIDTLLKILFMSYGISVPNNL